MHEFLATEPVTLQVLKPGLADGEVGFIEKNAMAVVIESRGFTQADGASAAFDFLIPGESELPPRQPDRLEERHLRRGDGPPMPRPRRLPPRHPLHGLLVHPRSPPPHPRRRFFSTESG